MQMAQRKLEQQPKNPLNWSEMLGVVKKAEPNHMDHREILLARWRRNETRDIDAHDTVARKPKKIDQWISMVAGEHP